MMVILNPGARHCAFKFDEGNVMVHNGVQILNAKSLAPRVIKIVGYYLVITNGCGLYPCLVSLKKR